MLDASLCRSEISFVVFVTNSRVTEALAPAHRAASDLARMPLRALSAAVLSASTLFFQSETAVPSLPRSTSRRSAYVRATGLLLLEVLADLRRRQDGTAAVEDHSTDLGVVIGVQLLGEVEVVGDVAHA